MSSSPVLVFDLGSHTIRTGLASSAAPDLLIPSAFPSTDHSFPIGTELPADCTPSFAISDGEVDSKDRITFLLATIFDKYFPETQQAPDDIGYAITDMPLATRESSIFLAEQVFEMLVGDRLVMKPPALFSLTNLALPTAMCIDIGYDICHTAAIADHVVIARSAQRSFAAGSALDLFGARCALELGNVTTWGEMERARKWKETQSRVVLEYDESMADDNGCTCGELLFRPQLFEAALPEGEEDERVSTLMEEPDLAQMIVTTIENCDLSYRGQLWNNIVVTGGTSKMPGLKERLMAELKKRAPQYADPKFRDAEDPVLCAWTGAAIGCMVDGESWVTKEDYDEDRNVIFDRFKQYAIKHYE